MTMAWTAQTGLGPRTVVLSLKVFIVLMFYTHERLGICTAQQLPMPLQPFLNNLTEHFCSEGCVSGLNCGDMGQQSANPLCLQICIKGDCHNNCWEASGNTTTPQCRSHCVYSDAVVCQQDDPSVWCVHRSDPPSTFCICSNQDMTYPSCEPPVTTTDPSRGKGDTPGTTEQSNTAAIVLGCLFALLLLFVIIGALIFYFRRQGRLPSFLKQTSNPAGLSSVPLEARDASRSKLPDPPVPGGNMEYSYAYDHRPAKPGAQEDPDQDDHTYYSVGEAGYREGNPRYVSDGQMKIPATKKPDTTKDDAKGHTYIVLHRDEDGDEVTDSSTGVKPKEVNDDYTSLVPTGDPKSRSEQPGKEDDVSPTLANGSGLRSPPVESPTMGDDGTYFPLIQAAVPKSPIKQSGYEDAKIPISTSPTEAQTINCDDDTYTPLVQAAAPMSPVKQSGYEEAKIPMPESHDSISSSEPQPDNTYTPLALTVEPKSQNKHSGYEAAIIPNPGSAAITDDTSPYDHFHRAQANESKEGARLTTDEEDYQHLVKN